MTLALRSSTEVEQEAVDAFAQTVEANRLVDDPTKAEQAGADLLEALSQVKPATLLMLRDSTRALNAIVHVAIEARGGDHAVAHEAVLAGDAEWVDLLGSTLDDGSGDAPAEA